MTAKEEAIQLVSKMCLLDCTDKNIIIAKQCALICVDEMLGIYDTEGYDSEDYKIIHIEEVKQEINKL
jgi:hypothetical protein